jgi:hypothetical protein
MYSDLGIGAKYTSGIQDASAGSSEKRNRSKPGEQ